MADEDEKLDNDDLNPEENDDSQEEEGQDESAFGDKVVDENIIPVGEFVEEIGLKGLARREAMKYV